MKTEEYFNQNLITNKFQFNFKGITNQFYIKKSSNTQRIENNKPHSSSYFNKKTINQISKNTGLTFLSEDKTQTNLCFINSTELTKDFKTTFDLSNLFNYIYAVLHSSIYNEKHKELLKLDYPPVPYPKSNDVFWKLAESGNKLIKLHTSIFGDSKPLLKSKTFKLINEIDEIEI